MGFSFSKPLVEDPAVYATKVDVDTANDELTDVRTYDYVIVGGGTASCVLAHRLTEDPTISVLVIEAGKSHKDELFSRLPGGFAKNFGSDTDWAYVTTPQMHTNNRSLPWPAGKMLGGGSSVNAMMYQRPCEDDLQEWTKLGATGWDWDNFKGYLNKAEKYNLRRNTPKINSSHHGNSGNWLTSLPDHYPIVNNFVEACEQVGISRIDDANSPEGPLGTSFAPAFIDQKGQRSSAATAYLTPAVLSRPNLLVALKATVTKIIISQSSGTPRATGVELTKGPGQPHYRVAARREVLCCAGAIKTPQILTLSGIGPKGELERLGIPAAKCLEAVGRNLYDHIGVTVPFRAKKGTTMDPLVTPTGSSLPLLRWLLTGGGPFAMLFGQGWAFVRSTDKDFQFAANAPGSPEAVDASSGPGSPDIEYIGAPVAFVNHGRDRAPRGTNSWTIGTILLRPQSHGTIKLKTNSIWDGADINPNYLNVESDLETLTRGTRFSLKIARSKALAKKLQLPADAQESEDFWYPGDADPDKITDETLKSFIRRRSQTLYHPMCTARIGQSQEDSVVDHELRVHGVANLRVVDASVFPAPFAGHTCAIVIGVAEKAADIIKKSSL